MTHWESQEEVTAAPSWAVNSLAAPPLLGLSFPIVTGEGGGREGGGQTLR